LKRKEKQAVELNDSWELHQSVQIKPLWSGPPWREVPLQQHQGWETLTGGHSQTWLQIFWSLLAPTPHSSLKTAVPVHHNHLKQRRGQASATHRNQRTDKSPQKRQKRILPNLLENNIKVW